MKFHPMPQEIRNEYQLRAAQIILGTPVLLPKIIQYHQALMYIWSLIYQIAAGILKMAEILRIRVPQMSLYQATCRQAPN